MNRVLRLSVGLAGASLALTAHAITFGDDFSVSQAGVANLDVSGTALGPAVDFAAGVKRTLGTIVLNNGLPGFARSTASIHDGYLSYSSDFEVEGEGFARYDFATARDFSHFDDFQVELLRNDQSATVTILGESANGFQSQRSVTVPANVDPTLVTITNAFGDIDASKITKVWVFVGGGKGLDAAVTKFEAVPEPASMAALGAGALALARRRGRR